MTFLPAQQRRVLRRPAAAAVEMVILVPFLGLLLVGTFEFSRGIMVKEILHDAARKACRTACRPGKDNTVVLADAHAVLKENNIDPTKATVTILVNDKQVDVKTAKANDKVSVRVAIPVKEVYWTTTILLRAETVESEVVVMMRQG